MPDIHITNQKVEVNRKPKKKRDPKRTIPKQPNFKRIPANNNEREDEASEWTIGNQSTKGKRGILTPKQTTIIKPTTI